MTLGPWPTLQNTRASLPAILKVSCKCPLNQFLKIWAAFCSWTQMKFWLDLHMSDGPGVAEDAIGFFPILWIYHCWLRLIFLLVNDSNFVGEVLELCCSNYKMSCWLNSTCLLLKLHLCSSCSSCSSTFQHCRLYWVILYWTLLSCFLLTFLMFEIPTSQARSASLFLLAISLVKSPRSLVSLLASPHSKCGWLVPTIAG